MLRVCVAALAEMSSHPYPLHSKPWFVPTCVAVFTLGLCAATLSPASNFDGYMVWRFCQRILQGIPYDESIWDHRTARFGVVVPALLVQAVFGTSLYSYYLVTSLTTAAAATATFVLGRALVNTWVGLLATASVLFSPVMCLYSDCQLTAELFSMTFVPLCLLHGYKYSQAGRTFDLWACSLWFGACYLAKETNLFFGPAVVWLLYRYAPRRWQTLLVFCSTNIALFVIETGLYRAFTAQRLGRASVILGNHLNNRPPIEEALPSVWHLFRRFTELRIDMALPIYVFLLGCVWLYVSRKRAAPGEPITMDKWAWLIIPTLCFLGITTFGVRSVNPLKLVQPFRDRYLLPSFGLQWIVIWALLDRHAALDALKRRFASLGPRSSWYVAAAAASLTLAGAHVGLRLMKRHAPTEERPFMVAVTAALESRTPMLAPPGDRKTMLFIQSFIWDRYQPAGWHVATLPNLREVMLPTNSELDAAQAEVALRGHLGQPILKTEYSYAYRAKPGVLAEQDFALGKQVVDKD